MSFKIKDTNKDYTIKESGLINLEDSKIEVLEWESLVFNERTKDYEFKNNYIEVDFKEIFYLNKVSKGVKLIKANLIEDYYIKKIGKCIRVEKPVYTFVNDSGNENFYFGEMTSESLLKGVRNPLHKDKFLKFKYAENYDESVLTAIGIEVDFNYEKNNIYFIRKKRIDLGSLGVIAIKY